MVYHIWNTIGNFPNLLESSIYVVSKYQLVDGEKECRIL